MRNILATLERPAPVCRNDRSAALRSRSLAFAVFLWGVWATDELVELSRAKWSRSSFRQIMGDFVEAEARAGRAPEETQARVELYLKAVEASVEALGQPRPHRARRRSRGGGQRCPTSPIRCAPTSRAASEPPARAKR